MSGLGMLGMAAGSMMGQMFDNDNRRRDFGYQKRLSEHQGQQNMGQAYYYNKLALDRWNKTNVGAQMKHMRDEGLNIGMMYGGAGTGDSSVTGGNASIAPTPNTNHMAAIGMNAGVNAMQTSANVDLTKAAAEKTKAEAEKIKGVDTEEAKTRIKDLLQGIKNKEAQEQLTMAEKYVQDMEYDKLIYVIENLYYDSQVNKNTVKAKTTILINSAVNSALQNELTSSKVKLTEQQEKQLWHKIRQDWVKAGLQGLDTIVKGRLGDIGKGGSGKLPKGRNLTPKQLQEMVDDHLKH